jgi:hypothetical protein
MLDAQSPDEHADDPHGTPEQRAGYTEPYPGPGHARPAMIDVRKLSSKRSPSNPERQRPGRRVDPAGSACNAQSCRREQRATREVRLTHHAVLPSLQPDASVIGLVAV